MSSNQVTQPKNEIIYLTGLSINKKDFHQTYKHLSQDKDFENIKKLLINKVKKVNTQFRIDMQKNQQNNIGGFFKFLQHKFYQNSKNIGVSQIDGFIKDNISEIVLNSIIDVTGDIATMIANQACPIGVSLFMDFVKTKTQDTIHRPAQNLVEANPIAQELMEEIYKSRASVIDFLEDSKSLDYFSIYLSNQSDSRGLVGLASDTESKTNFALNYGYCDLPFYKNLFIDGIHLTFKNSFYHKLNGERGIINGEKQQDFKKQIENCYLSHALDVFGSRITAEEINRTLNSNESSPEETLQNYKDFFQSPNVSHEAIVNFLSSKNLFGLDILSMILFASKYHTNTSQQIKLKVFIQTNNSNKINSKSQIQLFIEELFEYASSPSYFEFVTEETEADLVISGSYLTGNKIQNQTFPTNTENWENPFIELDTTISTQINSVYIPIKLFVSLPVRVDANGNYIADRKLIVPERLVHDITDGGSMNIITVGGIEHNRALARLINFHRQEYKEYRSFGFLENQFDMAQFKDKKYKHALLVPMNQPVSAFYEKLDTRIDNSDLTSINPSAHLLYFKLLDSNSYFSPTDGDKNLNWHVLSIYGLSAFSSTYASLYAIIKAKNNASKDREPILICNFAEGINPKKIKNHALRIKLTFESQQEMESGLRKICNGLDPISFLRIDIHQDLQNFISENTSASSLGLEGGNNVEIL